MKKTLLIAGALLTLTASMASAAPGLNFFWNDCGGGGTKSTNKAFACTANSNTFSDIMVMSFQPPAGLGDPNVTPGTGVVGCGHIIDLQGLTSPLVQWWQYKNAGSCRSSSVLAGATFLASCEDPWVGQGPSGAQFDLYQTNFGGNPARARIACSISVASAGATAVDPNLEYYSMTLALNHAKTVGTGSCAGCLDPVCLVLNDLQINQVAGSPGGSPHLSTPILSNFITWQGGAVGGAGCPGATPTINRSWGAVKSLYR